VRTWRRRSSSVIIAGDRTATQASFSGLESGAFARQIWRVQFASQLAQSRELDLRAAAASSLGAYSGVVAPPRTGLHPVLTNIHRRRFRKQPPARKICRP
jgi:hypothetical protein